MGGSWEEILLTEEEMEEALRNPAGLQAKMALDGIHRSTPPSLNFEQNDENTSAVKLKKGWLPFNSSRRHKPCEQPLFAAMYILMLFRFCRRA